MKNIKSLFKKHTKPEKWVDIERLFQDTIDNKSTDWLKERETQSKAKENTNTEATTKEENKYSLTRRYKYVDNETYKELGKIVKKEYYNNVKNGIKDDIVVEYNGKAYICDSGIENGKLNFAVYTIKEFNDTSLIEQYKEEFKYYDEDGIQNNASRDFDVLQETRVNEKGSTDVRFDGQSNRESLSDNKGKQNSNKKIIYRENEQSSSNRYKLTEDSQGRILTEAQQKFFKDSKVVDEDGNLLVVYQKTSVEALSTYFIYEIKELVINFTSSFY